MNKFALIRLAQKQHRSKRQGLLLGSLLTTLGRRCSSRGSRHPRGSSSPQRWHLAPGLHHLVAASEKNGKRWKKGSKATVSTHPKYSQASIYTTYASVSMKRVVSMDYTAECQKRRGKPSLSKTGIFKHLAAYRRVQINII